MIKDQKKIDEYYEMIIQKNPEYVGIFYVGVKTTGVFCRPIWPSKKPEKENCEFFETAKEALLASYRPCKRCQPLNIPSSLSPEVRKLIAAVEKNPERKWTDRRGLEREIENLRKKFNGALVPGTNNVLKKLKLELNHYFKGSLMEFSVPLAEELGTPYQKKIWKQYLQELL
ncbi:Ada metal-binding domain-containing protein [Leptotrichia sp. OH3620_COT-345]|uniref:Ada metal-binding domain-containing protein n=1 Tax=Leptotrichia sp. OH3620_COT-345 TaxID=2491048 RepID=UPI001F164840|nr:Ada metal-binding domain-containing protein [Leptotrichia sp. OH3620_COT-345]